MVMENSFIQMEVFMKVFGRIIKKKDLEFIFILIEQLILEVLKKIEKLIIIQSLNLKKFMMKNVRKKIKD